MTTTSVRLDLSLLLLLSWSLASSFLFPLFPNTCFCHRADCNYYHTTKKMMVPNGSLKISSVIDHSKTNDVTYEPMDDNAEFMVQTAGTTAAIFPTAATTTTTTSSGLSSSSSPLHQITSSSTPETSLVTSKRRRRLPDHKNRAQTIVQQIQDWSKVDVATALDLLLSQGKQQQQEGLPQNKHDQIYVDALHVCSKARRYDVAMAIYPSLCSSESCRQMAIYACGKSKQDDLVLDLLFLSHHHHHQQQHQRIMINDDDDNHNHKDIACHSKVSMASIACYNTALTVLPWEKAYHLLTHDMTSLNLPLEQKKGDDDVGLPQQHHDDDDEDEDNDSSILNVLSCNIVLNAMAKAHRKDEAMELWRSMTTNTVTSTLLQQPHHLASLPFIKRTFPTPDRTSWHHVMTACLNSCHYQQQREQQQRDRQDHVTINSCNDNQLTPFKQARDVYHDLFLPHVAAVNTMVQPRSTGNHHHGAKMNHGSHNIIGSKAIWNNGGGGLGFVVNERTYDLLARGYAKMGDWEMVRMVEEHQKQKQQQYQPQSHLDPFVAPESSQIVIDSALAVGGGGDDDDAAQHRSDKSMGQAALPPTSPLELSAMDSKFIDHNHNLGESQYYYFQHWTGMTKVGRGKAAYWILGEYRQDETVEKFDAMDTSTTKKTVVWRIALQPHRNPSKNGIKLVFFILGDPENAISPEAPESDASESPSQRNASSSNDSAGQVDHTWNKVGYLLMINTRQSSKINDGNGAEDKCDIAAGTSTLLGLYVDPVYRKQGLSKIFLAIWLHCCLVAKLRPQTGLIRKPLLALVLEHTFGFVPMTRDDDQSSLSAHSTKSVSTTSSTSSEMDVPHGVEVEIFVPPPTPCAGEPLLQGRTLEASKFYKTLGYDSHDKGSMSDMSVVHMYSPFGKSLMGSFSPWDLIREGIVIVNSPPPSGSRGRRTIHLLCNFISPSLPLQSTSSTAPVKHKMTMLEEQIQNVLKLAQTYDCGDYNESTKNCGYHNNALTIFLSDHELQNVFLGK